MKLRILLAGILLSGIAVLSGCGCTNNGTLNNTTTTTGTAPATTTTVSDTTAGTDGNGDYSADDNGIVNEEGDNGNDNVGIPDNNGTDNNDQNHINDNGAVTTDNKDGVNTIDEAAFASSYIEAGKIGWGLGKDRDDKNRPIDAVKAEEKYKALGGKFLCGEGKICLTFDEGYENGYTSEILDILKEKNVKAVFFVTYDYCKTSAPLVQRMIDEGHIVGNHTYSHPSMPDCSEKEMQEEVTLLHDYVKENFGYEMKLFRFPKGEFDEKSLKVVNDLGYTSLFWSFAYSDWDTANQPDKAESYAKIKDSTHSGIYLLHAVSRTNTEILGALLDYWKSEGYSVGSSL